MKYVTNVLLVLATLIVVLLVHQYFFCPQYQFVRSAPFKGPHWYNPYATINPSHWVKSNFHAHTGAWKSVTNGHGNAADVKNIYGKMGYGIHCVSNYHSIDKSLAGRSNYIPVYEHGYNILKTHQLVIGDDKVEWLDYFFPQTRSNKQRIINRLAASGNSVVVLNHPDVRVGYSNKDVVSLQNFQCIEVLNPTGVPSFGVWDAALSAGKPVFIVGSDDLHNIFDSLQSGKSCTVINTPSISKDSILACLKTGKGYGMKIGYLPGENSLQRIKRIKDQLPYLQSLTIHGDTLELALSDTAASISFIGQQGKELGTTRNVSSARYILKANDQYVRTAVHFNDNTEVYLNPVYRYDREQFASTGAAFIDMPVSIVFYTMGVLILSGWVLLLFQIATGRNLLREIFLRIPGPFPPVRKQFPRLNNS